MAIDIRYPITRPEDDAWILSLRGARNAVAPDRPYAALVEEERSSAGEIVPIATLFLTNRECPFRCLMCDLWRNTLEETVPAGAIAEQIQAGLAGLGPARQIKLYNSGSFFDPRAIPPGEDPKIARLVQSFERVIVESHPAFIGARCQSFRDQIEGDLEVAIGLETAHPVVLDRLNKRMTLESFSRAAGWLVERGIAVRVFILLRPPFLTEAEGLEWARRSLDFAFDAGASVCSLIPTRAGNGALDVLAARGNFAPPSLCSLEAALAYGLERNRGRVFADLWDLERFRRCEVCFPARMARLQTMNLQQTVPAPAACSSCDGQ
jgi:archaeosine synthase beta-subunit